MKRLSILLSVMLVTMFVLAACGGAATEEPAAAEPTATPKAAVEEPTDTPEPAPEPTEAPTEEPAADESAALVIWADNTRAPVLQELSEDFQNEYGLSIDVQLVDFGDIRENFQVAGPAGEGPDIIVGAHDWLGELVASGLVAPVDLGSAAGNFLPAAVQAFSYDGELYGMPYAMENVALFRNTDLVPDAPATWSEVMEIATQLEADGKATLGYNLQAADPYHFFPIQTAFGGYVFGVDENGYNPMDVGIDSEGSLAAAEWLETMVQGGHLREDMDWDTLHALFESGEVGMFITGPWALDRIRESGVPYAISALPGETQEGQPFLGVQGFMVSAFSEDPLLAQAFLTEFVATDEVMQAMFDADPRPSAYLPVREAVDDPDLVAFAEAGANGLPMPAIPEMGAVWGSWGDAITLIFQGQQAADEAFMNAGAQIREAVGAPAAEGGPVAAVTGFEWPEAPASEGNFVGVDPSGQTVLWWHNHSGSREEKLAVMIDKFNTENPYGITVDAQNQGRYNDIREKMGAGAVSGELPDIVVGYQNDQAFYASVDLLQDMDLYVKDSYWGLSDEDVADFVPGIFMQDVHPAFDNKRLGFPPNRSMEVIYMNTSWMEELGFDPTATLTPELFEEIACAAAADRGDGEGGYVVRFDASQVAAAALARGVNVLTDDGQGYNYDRPELVEYFEQIRRMVDNGCAWVSPERYHDAEFAARQGIFYAGSTSGLPYAQGSLDDAGNSDVWSIAPIPYTTAEPKQNLYGGSVMMPYSTPEKELAAWIFIKWYTSPEAQADWVKASNYFSPRYSTADLLGDYVENNPKYAVALELLPYAEFEPQLISYSDVRNAVHDAFQEIINTDVDIAERLAALDAEAAELHAEAIE